MIDNDIIKALECCGKPVNEECCSECPYHLGGEEYCHKLIGDTIDLINRQKAEIERLNGCVKSEEEVRAIANATIQAGIGIIKAEAVKELLEKIEKQAILSEDDVYWVELDDIYNLVKEMVGEG